MPRYLDQHRYLERVPIDLLVTGFQPFAGSTQNPSAEIATALPKVLSALPGSPKVVAAVLPVVFEEAFTEVAELIAEHQPRAVLCLGQAEGRRAVSFERVALNFQDARIPDAKGAQPIAGLIADGSAAAYFSTLPLEAMAEAARHAGVPVEFSLTAGAYVCNDLFFRLQQHLLDAGIPSGFVHVPIMESQVGEFPEGTPHLALASMIEAVAAASRVLLES